MTTDKPLGNPVRPFASTFSALSVIKQKFCCAACGEIRAPFQTSTESGRLEYYCRNCCNENG